MGDVADSVVLVGCIDFLSFVLCVITLEMNLSYEAGVTVLRSVSIIIFFVIKTTKQVCLYFVDKKNKWYEIPYVTFTVLDKLWHGYNPNDFLYY